jgi:hypothetical protein
VAKVIKTCKVCGKEYEYCHTNRPSGLFRWQDVACSPECGNEYFRRIAISRGELVEEPSKAESAEVQPATSVEAPKKKTVKQRKRKTED